MKRHYLYALFCFLLMNISGWAVVSETVYDFETEESNAHWKLGSDYNDWVIGQGAGSYENGTYAMYPSKPFSEKNYEFGLTSNSLSAWAQCLDTIIGEVQISFAWRESRSSYYYGLRVYLVPVSGAQPQDGSRSIPEGTIEIGTKTDFYGKEDWTEFVDSVRTLEGSFFLYFQWWTSADYYRSGGTPVAVDNISIAYSDFNDFEFSLQADSTYKVTNYVGTETKITIPDSYKGKPVSTIAKTLGNDNKIITEVTIPSSIKRVEENAFYTNHSSLIKTNYLGTIAQWCDIDFIDEDSNPTTYSKNLYINDTLVTDLVIPNGVDSIKKYTFYRNDSITSVSLPQSVTFIGAKAFDYCENIKKTNFTGTIAQWCNIEFWGAYSNPISYSKNLYINDALITDLVIPNGIQRLKEYLFYRDTCITSVTLPSSISRIEENVFDGCENIRKTNYLGTIAQWCKVDFAGISSNPMYYSNNLYNNNRLITDLVIPSGVDSVKKYAFFADTCLTSITLPSSLHYIGWYATGCPKLRKTNFLGTLQQWCCIQFYNNPVRYSQNLYLNNKLITDLVIPDGVSIINNDAFENDTCITSVTIPSSVSYISGFSGCKNIRKTNYLGTIQQWCNIEFGSHPVEYSYNLYLNDSLITDLVIPEGITEIPSNAFENDTCLYSLTLPSSGLEEIGSSSFKGCKNLRTINAPCATPPVCSNSSYSNPFPNDHTINVYVTPENYYTYLYDSYWRTLNLVTEAKFAILQEEITQSKCRLKAQYYTTDSTFHKVGYIFSGDTTWMPEYNPILTINMDSLSPSQEYGIEMIVEDSCTVDSIALYDDGRPDNLSNWENTSSYYTYWKANSYGGYYYIDLNYSYSNSTLSQTISLKAGATYTIAFNAYATKSGYSNLSLSLQMINDGELCFSDTMTSLPNQWSHYTFEVTPQYDGEYAFSIKGSGSRSATLYIDDISITTSPYKYWGYKTTHKYTFMTKDINSELWRLYGSQGETTIPIRATMNCGDALCSAAKVKVNYGYVTTDIIPMDSTGIGTFEKYTTLTDLTPGEEYTVSLYATLYDKDTHSEYEKFIKKETFSTSNVSSSVKIGNPTQTTIPITYSQKIGSAVSMESGISYGIGTSMANAQDIKYVQINSRNNLTLDTVITNLRPNTKYVFRSYIKLPGDVYRYGTEQQVQTKSISLGFSAKSTQTTMALGITYDCGDANRAQQEGRLYLDEQLIHTYTDLQEGAQRIDTMLTNLLPNTSYRLSLAIYDTQSGEQSSDTRSLQKSTLPILIGKPEITQYGQTFASINSGSDYGDATLITETIELRDPSADTLVCQEELTNHMIKLTNLHQNKTYTYRTTLTTVQAGTMQSEWQDFTTKEITLSTQDADGISNTSVYLHGTVDCDQESYTEVGFEWKRSDAPSTVNPQRLLVTDRTDENLIFRLEGLSPDRYYDFRAFCMYQGKTYYGAWVGFLTADKEVVIAPTVETLGATANEKGVEMRGKVVSGTEPILQQGFESWIKGSTTIATTVAEGKTMTAYIPEPWAYETYQYRAYAKTASGTTYGETLEVTTGYIEREIADVEVTPSTNSAEVTWAAIEVADYYILTLFRDKEMSDTLAIYEVSPSGKVKQVRKPMAKIETITCTIEDLYQNTTYYFAVQAYNDEDQMIAEEIGSFTTLKEEMGMQDAEAGSEAGVQKVLHNGQVLIIRNGKVYTAMGVALE